MGFLLRSVALLLFAGCAAAPTSDPRTDLSGWVTEAIELPPGFAPDLPAGREVLLFAPGMFEAGAPDFWSYAFLMEVQGSAVDTARLEEIFELYYDGLISAVAPGKGFDVPADPASVSFRAAGVGHFVGEVSTLDAFVTGAPLELHMLVDAEAIGGERTLLRVMASPAAPGDAAIWRALEDALASLAL